MENIVLPWDNKEQLSVQAMFLAQRIDLRSFDKLKKLTVSPLIVESGNGIVVMFKYGVTVFIGLDSMDIVGFLEQLQPYLIDSLEKPETETMNLIKSAEDSEGVHGENITLTSFDLIRLQLVSDILAKSVVLAHYEASLHTQMDRIEPLALSLKKGRQLGHKNHDLLQHIGDSLLIESKMIGRVEISEKPELLWENPELERIYLKLTNEFELKERQTSIEHKLSLISRTAETLLDVLHNQRSLRVEWYIVILILIEIFLTLSEKF